jgi:hypothetical protein
VNKSLAVYQDLAARVGRDADAQVRLALWCEEQGLEAERVKHLVRAVLAEPNHATARGLLGLMSYAGKWRQPQEIAEKLPSDEALAAALAEYNTRRDQTADTADAQWKLALWCEQHGLQPEAKAHLVAVTRLDPSHERAWKHLGCRLQNGRWMTPEQIDEEEAEVVARRKADAYWSKRLESIKRMLAIRGRRADAERALVEVTDPRAARAVWTYFARGGEADQGRAVQLFGQIDAPEASLDLAALAVSSPAPEVRRKATETLVRRDPREFVGALIERIRTPLKYEVRFVEGPGKPGSLFVEGEKFNIRRIYEAPLPPGERDRRTDLDLDLDLDRRLLTPDPADTTPHVPVLLASRRDKDDDDRDEKRDEERDRRDTIERNWQEAKRAAASAEQRLEADLMVVRAYNEDAEANNKRVLPVLQAVTVKDLGSDRQTWSRWWTNERGYVYKETTGPKPTYQEEVPPSYVPNFNRVSHSCFGAGTPVQTITGTRPIESLKVGDRILTQDTTTGALSFQPILTVYHNPPAPTLKIELGDQPVIATAIHRFWRAGKGWTMARELKPGDLIRTLGGTAQVAAVTENAVQPVFNLEVAEGHTFFVGGRATLVHDNSLVQPVHQPFDAAPDVAAVGSPTNPVARPRRSS